MSVFPRTAPGPRQGRTYVLVAHPGHELRLYGWLEGVRPRVAALTDGADSNGEGRLQPSRNFLAGLGCEVGEPFGAASDAAFYAAMMSHDARFFTDILETLAADVERSGAETVISDAAEGYNPTHDLCQAMAAAAARLVRRRTGRSIEHYAFSLTEWVTGFSPPVTPVLLHLDPAAHRRKIAACYAYKAMEGEVRAAMTAKGEAYFATERLWPAAGFEYLPDAPLYEEIAAERVRAGVYRNALSARGHVLPIAEDLARYAALGTLEEPQMASREATEA